MANSLIKEYLRSENLPKDINLFDLPLSQAMAIEFRRLAQQADFVHDQERAQKYRSLSREVLKQPSTKGSEFNDLDFHLVEEIMSAETVNVDVIIDFLKEKKFTRIPVLSNTPAAIREQFAEHFEIDVVPADQIDITDFEQMMRPIEESQVPDWYRQVQADIKADKEFTNIFKGIKDRWFLFMIVFLAFLASAGFLYGVAIEVNDIVFGLDLFFSIYGITAITRSVEQIRRAEKWNRKSRRETRSPYAQAFSELPGAGDEGFSQNATKLTKKGGMSWDDFKKNFGFEAGNEKSLIDQYIAYNQAHGFTVTRDEVTDQLAEKVIANEFGGQAPTVAIVIPTYQTSIEEMEALLVSIKNQAYPVDNAYVVYNDNPNDPDPGRKDKKQAEFFEFQTLVNRINDTPGRNNCQIKLFAQPARGKREAMAMGFAAALGKDYLEDVKQKYAEKFNNGMLKEEAYKNITQKINSMIANIELDELPDIRHDYVLNIDSDTEIADPLAVLNSAILMKNNPKAGTTTGDVSVINRDFNLLSEMTYQRYWRAFFVERAAQANDGQVTCMSGPWVFMQSDALSEVLDEWYFQEFLGERTTYGDDRHLSSLMLKYGWESLFTGDSKVLTDCPTDWKVFLRQQLRWNKSFNRENLFLLNFIHKMSKFVQMDVAYQQVFPFATMVIWGSIMYRAASAAIDKDFFAGLTTTIPYGVALLLYNELFFGLYGAIKNKDLKFFLSPVYIYYYAKGLLRTKLKAYFQAKDKTWGTKGEAPSEEVIIDDFAKEKGAIVDQIMGEAAFKAEDPDNFEN